MSLVVNNPAGQGPRLTAFERHQQLVNNYLKFYGGSKNNGNDATVRTDIDALRDSYRFIRSEEDDAGGGREVRLALRYYERLFREYAICDLSRHKESKVGMRWRTQAEVVSGKGQFVCGTKGCSTAAGLCSYEVNFKYLEAGDQRQALVKLRLCSSCAYKLNYKKEQQYRKAGVTTDYGHRPKRARDDASHGSSRATQNVDGSSSGWDASTFAPSELASMPAEATARPRVGATAGGNAQLPGNEAAGSVLPGDDSLWEAPRKVEVATVEEDIDEYFTGLFQ